MEMYSKAVSEMYSQFKKEEDHPLKKYVGRLAKLGGKKLEVVGYRNDTDSTRVLIVDCTKIKGWVGKSPGAGDVIFKECESYWYVSIDSLID